MTWVHHLLPCLLPLLMALLTLFLVMAPFTFHVLGFLLFLMFLIFICSCCLLVRSLVIIVASFLSLTLALFRIVVGGPLVGTGHQLRDPPRLWDLDWLLLPSASTRCQSSSTIDATAFVAATSVFFFAQWHHRLGHMCGSRLSSLVRSGVLGKVSGDTSLPVWVVSLTSNYSLRGVTPLERLFGRPPQYSHLRVFGCVAFVLLQPRARTKLTTQSI